MKRLFFIFMIVLSILLVSCAKAEIIFSEIMYAPTFNEDYNEWIEIYNSGSSDINLTDWKLCNINLLPGYVDHSDNGTIKENNGLLLKAGEYAVISDGKSGTDAYNNFDINGLAVHTNAASTCGGLTNKGKEIVLSGNDTNVSITYDNSTGLKDNKSIQLVNGEWCEGIPTPGKANECYVAPSEDNPDEHYLGDNESNSNNETDDALNETTNETIQTNQTNQINSSSSTNTSSSKITSSKTGTAKQTASLTAKTVADSEENLSENTTEKQVVYQSKTDKMEKAALYLAIGLFIGIAIYFFKSNN